MPVKSKSRKTKSRSRKTTKATCDTACNTTKSTKSTCKTIDTTCAKDFAPKSKHGFEPFECLGITKYSEIEDPMFKALYGLMVYIYDNRPDLRDLVESCAADANPDKFMIEKILGSMWTLQASDLPLGNLMGIFMAEYGMIHGTGDTPEDRRIDFYNNEKSATVEMTGEFAPFGASYPVEAHCSGDRQDDQLPYLQLALELHQVPFTKVYALLLIDTSMKSNNLPKDYDDIIDMIDGPTVQAAVKINPRIARMISALHKHVDCCTNNHKKPCETELDCCEETCRL